jgi:quinol monooxygenase YgiN
VFGSVAKFRVRSDVSEEEVERVFASLPQPKGAVGVLRLRSASDPRELWVAGAFESEQVYRQTADSPEQSEQFAKLRDLMDGEPEWHDGEVLDFRQY